MAGKNWVYFAGCLKFPFQRDVDTKSVRGTDRPTELDEGFLKLSNLNTMTLFLESTTILLLHDSSLSPDPFFHPGGLPGHSIHRDPL